ncbi:heat-inducible transcriptional repressor HrcA [Paraconexibacter sp.]|uniref:heat-inducible transcriptional repressor HrcA n=1 Tax=Paraconexibacter sp. TaxID=2949640 RepID=UPI003564B401
MLSPRQQVILRKVVDAYLVSGAPVGSKALAADPDLDCGPSTIRNELALLEEHGLLAHPHTSAGRVPTEAGHRYVVDGLLEGHVPLPAPSEPLELQLVRREVDEAMRVTTETLSQVTNLLAIVSAPPLDTATIRHIEVLALQPTVLMVVVITSTGGVTKRLFTFERPVDPGLVAWASDELNGRLVGMGLGARMLAQRLHDPSFGAVERAFLDALSPAFTDLAETADDTLYVDGAARLLADHGVQDLSEINELLTMLERRVSLLGVLRSALGERDVLVRIGQENETPALRSLAVVASGYGLPARKLGTVSVIGPVRMDYGAAIATVREAAFQLSRFIEEVYDA